MLTACFPWPCQPCLCCPWVGLVPFSLKLWNTHWCMLMRSTVGISNLSLSSSTVSLYLSPFHFLSTYSSPPSLSLSLHPSLWEKLGPGSSKWAGPNKSSIRFHRAIFAKASLDSRVMITIKRWKGAGKKSREKKCRRYINRNVLWCLPTINLMQYLKSRFRI